MDNFNFFNYLESVSPATNIYHTLTKLWMFQSLKLNKFGERVVALERNASLRVRIPLRHRFSFAILIRCASG